MATLETEFEHDFLRQLATLTKCDRPDTDEVKGMAVYAPASEVVRELNQAFVAGAEYALRRLASEHMEGCLCEACVRSEAMRLLIAREYRPNAVLGFAHVVKLQRVGV